MRPALALNGGFITTTVGASSSGSVLLICSAFSVITLDAGNTLCSRAARRADSSLSTSLAPAFLANTARPPIPALGSSIRSPAVMLATQLAAKARAGTVENCWNSSCSAVRLVCVGSKAVTRSSAAMVSSAPSRSVLGLNDRP